MRVCIRYFARHHVGFVALFIALSGTAYAASLPRNSVGTAQLKRGAVNSAKVKNHSLQKADLARGVVRRGEPGAVGPPGPTGDPGPPGVAGVTARRSIRGDEYSNNLALCKDGEVATGGGGEVGPQTNTAAIISSHPWPLGDGVTPTGWRVAAVDTEGTPFVLAWVVCARLR
jgi:hypothetical protein